MTAVFIAGIVPFLLPFPLFSSFFLFSWKLDFWMLENKHIGWICTLYLYCVLYIFRTHSVWSFNFAWKPGSLKFRISYFGG